MSKNFTLRPYQKETVKSIFNSYDRGIRRQLAVLFTGAGKTICAIHILKKYLDQGKNVLVLVDQEDLVWQWKKRAHEVDGNLRVGIEKAEYTAKSNGQFVVATVQTLGRKGKKRIKKFDKDHFDLCIIDEGHKSITETWFRVLEYFGFGKDNFDDDNLLLAWTATPWRTSGESMGILYDDIVANYDIRYGIANGWLTDIEIYDVNTSTDISSVDKYKDDFNQKQLSEAVNNDTRNEEVVKAYKEVAEGEQAIVTCASVDHAYNIAKAFEANDISAEVIEAETDKQDRKEYLEKHDKGDLKVLCHYNTLSTGIDLPELSVLIFARPVRSKLLYIQTLGRALRPSQSAFVDAFDSAEKRRKSIDNSVKPVAKVIDFHDEAGNHNVAHVPSLFGLHNELQTDEPKRFYKEVVEPLEKVQKEKGVDISKIKDLDEIDLIVKNRKVDIQSLKVDPEIRQFTNRRWVSIGEDSYEIMYSENNKVLIIESDDSKKELLDKKEWKLLEYDSKDEVTKELQTFNSLSGAFKIADEYADEMGYEKQFKEIAPWMKQGVTEKQYNLLMKLYTYKTGYCEFEILNERYEDTGVRKLKYKKTGEEIFRGEASTLINEKFNK